MPLFWVLFGGCSWIFGYHFGLFPNFWVSFLGYSRIFGYHFLVKFDFFKNNLDFWGTDFDISINDIVQCCLQGFCFCDSTVLVSVLYACAKSFILSITAISLSSYICSAFLFQHLSAIVDNFQCTKIKSDE